MSDSQAGLLARLRRWWATDTKRPTQGEQVSMDRRREVRVPIELKVAIKFESLDDIVHSRTVNISEGGMFISTRSPRPEGTRVRVQIEVAERGALLTGIVVHRLTPAAAGREPPGMGVQFTNLSEDGRALVDEILAREQA